MKHEVWLLDDDLSILEAMKIILEDEGYKVRTFSSYEMLESQLKKGKPQIIFLDLRLLGESGLDAAKKLKSKKTTREIPLVIVSADKAIVQKAQEAQAAAYLKKPFNIVELVNITQTILT